MSNLTLKEQLQALSLGSNVPNEIASKKIENKRKPSSRDKTVNKTKPAWLEQAQYGVELLKAYFPACFKDAKEVAPLKVGIKQDLVKFLSTRDEIVLGDKACMVNSLAYYVNSIAYLKCVVEGAQRIDLEGQPAGNVTADEAKYSVENRQSKMSKKKNAGNDTATQK